MLPQLIIHADWSVSPTKRWQAKATRSSDGAYYLHAPEPVGETATWLERLRIEAGSAGVFLGVDFPIGLPLAYAERAGITDFLDLLPALGEGKWDEFYQVAVEPRQIGLRRPFYPARPGGTRQQHLLDGLGVNHINDLRRVCDLGHAGRRAAAPIFWTMGAQQVGKAAITGWREVLGPALRAGAAVTIWPFAGQLDVLLAHSGIVVAESYPAEFYGHLEVAYTLDSGGKRRQAARAANAAPLMAWAKATPVTCSAELVAAIGDGFGDAAEAEDRFDAVTGLMGMLNVLFGNRPAGEPGDERVRRVEGWILGQTLTNQADTATG